MEYSFALIFIFIFYPLCLALLFKYYTKFSLLICYFISFLIQWICFLNTNPKSLYSNDKLAVMNLFPTEYRPHVQFSLIDVHNIVFEYPIIIKPTVCSGDCVGVRIIKSIDELNEFLKKCKNKHEFMFQNYLDDHIEIALMWRKFPWESHGKVIEIIEKTNTHDDIRKWNNDYLINHSSLINNDLHKLFNKMANFIPNLNICRYDIRLKNINNLQKGDFKILEVNGSMGFSLDEYNTGLNYFIDESNWYLQRILLGFINIITFKCYNPISLLIKMIQSYYSMIKCFTWENLYET